MAIHFTCDMCDKVLENLADLYRRKVIFTNGAGKVLASYTQTIEVCAKCALAEAAANRQPRGRKRASRNANIAE